MNRRWAVAVTAVLVLSSFAGAGAASGATGPAPQAAADPVVAAAGDIACAPPATRTASSCHHRDTSDLLVAGGYDAVLALGDIQYECGQASAYRSVYDPTWGRVKAVTRPAVGDNEYTDGKGCTTAGAAGYFGYFGSAATPLQPGCRSGCRGWYSYELGAWHIVVLNTECGRVGGCTRTSPQGRWLAADLAASRARCTLAYWHRPRWQDNGRTSSNASWFVQALYDAGAEVVLAGHEHLYERFAPQTPAGVADPDGIRQFIVGTGGKSRHGLARTPPRNAEARTASAYGVLALTLRADGYDWRFVPEAGRSFTDAGSHPCH